LISELLNLTKKDTSLKPDMYCNISAIYSRKLAAEADNASNDYKAGSFEGIALGYFKMAANLSDGRLYGDNRYKTYADLLDQHKRMVLRSAKAMPAEYANDYARGVLDGLTIIAGTYKEQGDELVEFRDEYVSYLQEKGLDVLPNSKVSKALLGASGTKLKSELLKSVILSDKVHH